MEDHSVADYHLQPLEDPTLEQVSVQRTLGLHSKPSLEPAPGGTCGPKERGANARNTVIGRTCDPFGVLWWSSLFLKDCTLWKGPVLGQFVKNCSLWNGLTLEKFVEDCLLWEGLHTGAEECEQPFP
ncbi:hypothetical protein WISP_10547 [Willisornis vidua]|uniref:Uncharacterized protein n=1 Tax=Willisornis vidua TaxID=1566151 RepID=A0ABQ9DSN8_9PASS|nr:hypothetical protein WISP_10547 [Willisornis vidua]